MKTAPILLSTKVTNAIKAKNAARGIPLNLGFHLKNISLNGARRGCSGFVENIDTGSVVYLTTEPCCSDVVSMAGKCMYRYAKDLKDYSSNNVTNGNNRWCAYEDLQGNVLELLATGKAIRR